MTKLNFLRKTFAIFFVLTVLVSCSPHELRHENLPPPIDYKAIQEDLQNLLRNTQVVDVRESEINGVYEVYYNGTYPGIVYYYPEKHLFIFGEVWTITGQSITADKREVFLKMIKAPLSKEVRKKETD